MDEKQVEVIDEYKDGVLIRRTVNGKEVPVDWGLEANKVIISEVAFSPSSMAEVFPPYETVGEEIYEALYVHGKVSSFSFKAELIKLPWYTKLVYKVRTWINRS